MWLVLLSVVGGAGFLALLLGPIALWATPAKGLQAKDLADAIGSTRQTLLAAVGGVGLLTGAAFTARTYYLSQRGQLTDRYTRAIGLLASDKLTERIGGVYALEHLMIESEREHETVVEVLAAFVRDQTPLPVSVEIPSDAEHDHKVTAWGTRLRTDVQAALTVLGRRPRRPERADFVDLSRSDLSGADLRGLNLDDVWFWRSSLRSAKLQGGSFKGANFAFADLKEAGLSSAILQDACLYRTQLRGAVLLGADLQDADFTEALLQGAYLAEADLHNAVFEEARLEGADFVAFPTGSPAEPPRRLTAEQLASAVIDGSTRLPDGLSEAVQRVAQLKAATSDGPTGSPPSSADSPGLSDPGGDVDNLTPSSGALPRRAVTETKTETESEEGSCG